MNPKCKMLYKTSGKAVKTSEKYLNLWQGRVLDFEIKIMIHKKGKAWLFTIGHLPAEDLKRMKRPGTIWRKYLQLYIQHRPKTGKKHVKSYKNSAVNK